MNRISVINIGSKKINDKFIYNLIDFISLKDLLNKIETKYIMFIDNIKNINITEVKKTTINTQKKYEILIFSDCFDYFPNKVDINKIEKDFLQTLMIDFKGVAYDKELLISSEISNKDLKNFKKFNLKIMKSKINIKLIEKNVYNKKLDIQFNIEDIFKLKDLEEKQSYIYIYKLMNIVIESIYEWDKKTSENIIKILKNKITDINANSFLEFLKIILNDNQYNKTKILFLMFNDSSYSEIYFLSREINEKKQTENELKKVNLEKERLSFALKSNRLKISIYYDKITAYLRRVSVAIEYWITKPFLFNKDIWLIGERSDQAEDNAYRFFKYVRETHPSKKIYYIIDKNSIQYENVEKLGNVININSFKHRIYLMHAKKLISAYDFFNFLLPSDKNRFKKYNMKYMNSTRVFLQHGVAMNKANYYNKYINKYDYILVSTNKEFNMFTEEYRYDADKIIKIGLPRYDQLLDMSIHNKNKKILFMPTWRNSLVNLNDEDFKKTDYYNSINDLINNEELHKILKENNIELIVYLHYQMQIFNHCFDIKFKNIMLKSRENSIVQDLLKESNLLITDYSSVGVDFAYLNKPVIFYQFSKHNFHYDINKEYNYTLYSDFGKVVTTEEEVISTLNTWQNTGFENFYDIKDDLFYNRKSIDNCKKIYQFINSIPRKDIKSYEVNIYNGNEVKEKRIYDCNYNFVSREYYNNKRKISELLYKNGSIDKQIVYNEYEKPIKKVNFYKDIKVGIEYLDEYDKNGNIIIKHNVTSLGILSSKIIYYKNSNKIKTISKYNINTETISTVKHFYENGKLKSELIYSDEGNANKYYYYNENGVMLREYNYYNSGKVKEKIFYSQETLYPIKKQLISEINQKIILENRFKDNKHLNEKIYLEV